MVNLNRAGIARQQVGEHAALSPAREGGVKA